MLLQRFGASRNAATAVAQLGQRGKEIAIRPLTTIQRTAFQRHALSAPSAALASLASHCSVCGGRVQSRLNLAAAAARTLHLRVQAANTSLFAHSGEDQIAKRTFKEYSGQRLGVKEKVKCNSSEVSHSTFFAAQICVHLRVSVLFACSASPKVKLIFLSTLLLINWLTC
jgi:hypothetical protein